MTTKEMVYACDTMLKTVTKDDNIFIPTTEWITYLRLAQETVFRSIIPLDADTYSQFDLNQTARSNLAGLIKDKSYSQSDARDYTTSKFSGINYIFDYPQDLKYIDVAEVVMTSTKSNTDFTCRCKDIEPRFYHQNRKNPFKKPFSNICWRLDYGNGLKRYSEIVIPEGFTLKLFTIRYLINLSCLDYDTDCLLASSLHPDVVNEAVNLALKASQNNMYLTRLKSSDENNS